METIKYKGIKIKIEQDTDAQNPFEDWDCNMPTMVESGRYKKDYSDGKINNYLAYDVLSDGQITRHQKVLEDIFEGSFYLDDFKLDGYTKQDKIDKIRESISECDDFDKLESFCNQFKVPCLNSYTRGYSQGDHADVFVCYTKEFEKESGCTKEYFTKEAMQGTIDLWGYWAWGNVYGYFVNKTGDSCWGFYGDDHEKSGLLEEAKGNIDHYLEEKKKKKEAKLKILIKNHVPLDKRVQLI